MSNLEIRVLQDVDEFEAAENVQRAAWGFENDINIVPAHFLEALSKHCGGSIIGAYLDGCMLGFMLIVVTPDRAIQYLHMIGVHPNHQGGGGGIHVGEPLFHFYGEEAAKKGVEELHWTFDPLQGQNASLYVHKLGARAVRYISDAYGQAKGAGINVGLPTDRLLVSWKVGTVPAPSDWTDFPPLVSAVEEIGDTSHFAVEIPFNINELKKSDMDLAKKFLLDGRGVFTEALLKGYEVVDFVCRKEIRRNFYVLRRGG
jgi:predicted GNAT superfamily acetyltransferase